MSPDCFTHYDWSRSYLLPDHVISHIPHRGSVGMLGAYNVARGLLVEICRHLVGSIPVAVHYREREEPGGDIVLTMTATLRCRTGAVVTVETCVGNVDGLIRRWGTGRCTSTVSTAPTRTGRGPRPHRCRATSSAATSERLAGARARSRAPA